MTFKAKDSNFQAWVEHTYDPDNGTSEIIWLGDSNDNQRIALSYDDMYYLCEWFKNKTF